MDDAARSQILTFDETVPLPAPVVSRFPGFWISVAWILMYFGFQLLFGAIVFAIMFISDKELMKKAIAGGSPEQMQAQLMTQIGLPIFVSVLLAGLVTLAILWVHLRKDQRYERIGLFASSKIPLWLTIALGVGLMVGVGLLCEAYSTYVVPGKELQAGVNQLIAGIPKTPVNHLILFFTIAILAPILEELLFRGYLQTSLMRHMKPWAAILLASSIFGIVHMQPLAFPVLTALGAVFGYLYYRTGSLKVNMVLHMLNNGVAYILMVMGISGGA